MFSVVLLSRMINISKIRHSSFPRHFLRILKFSPGFTRFTPPTIRNLSIYPIETFHSVHYSPLPVRSGFTIQFKDIPIKERLQQLRLDQKVEYDRLCERSPEQDSLTAVIDSVILIFRVSVRVSVNL